jgi:hypothetical protein
MLEMQKLYISFDMKATKCLIFSCQSMVGKALNFEMGGNQLTYSQKRKRKTLSPKHDQFRVFFIDILLF